MPGRLKTVTNITSLEHFNEIINGDKKKIIVDFWANWCGPCRMISPYFYKLAERAPDNVGMYMVNIDEVMEVPKEFKIKAIPTFMYFKGGIKVAEVTGADREAVETLVSQAAQDDSDDLEKIAEVTGEDDDSVDGLVSQAAQHDGLKMEGGKKEAEVTHSDVDAVKALSMLSQAAQDDVLKMEGGKKVAEVRGADDAVNGLVSQSVQPEDDDLKMKKQPSEFDM